MNSYTYDEIVVGQEARFAVTLSDEHMRMFRELTGDVNPLHNDADYAESKGFAGRVAYGMLTASFLSALAGVYLPGKLSLIHEVAVKFVNPCVVTDGGVNLTVIGKCLEKHDTFKRITLKVRVVDSSGTTILRGTMKIGVTDDEQ